MSEYCYFFYIFLDKLSKKVRLDLRGGGNRFLFLLGGDVKLYYKGYGYKER